MTNINKKWLLKASPWMKDGPRLPQLGIRGIMLIALLFLGSVSGIAYVGLPAIGGQTTICPTTTTNLTNAVAGGVWSSSNTSIATVNPTTGVVTGVAGGYVYITYTVGVSYISTLVTVTYPITGGSTVCVGNNLNLADATPTGLWSTSDASIATVTLGVVRGIAPGTVTISYGRSGACAVQQVVTVGSNGVADIDGTGALGVCVGGTITATDPTPSGTWTSSTPTLATINSSTGVINGVAAGPVVITYSLSGCYKTRPLTVASPTMLASITGATNVCAGSTTVFADATPMGTWSSSNTAVATVNTDGKVTGRSVGSATISYTKTGCSVTKVVSVDPNTIAPIVGSSNVCVGQTTTLTDATPGLTWSSSNNSIATVAGGVVTGVAAGNDTIYYTAVGGCFKALAITVNTGTVGAITGAGAVCQGATTTLTDAVLGGAWTTSDPSVATVSAFGVVTGVAAGSASISYTRLGCSIVQAMVVNPLPLAITGTKRECANNKFNTTTLTDATPSGSWSSSNTSVATVAGGVVTGVTSGVVNITYTLPTGCYITTTDTVYGPGPIAGGSTACMGPFTYLYLSNTTLGGAWTSQTTSKATIGGTSGVVTAVAPGLDSILYTVTYSAGLVCYVAKQITVANSPGFITGNFTTCLGATTVLADTTALGTWSSSNTAIATVGSTTGVVTGVATGGVVISYSKNGCSRTANVSVGAALSAITGSGNVCVGLATITLTNSNPGGAWSASNTNVNIAASGSATAAVTGVVAGTSIVSYTLGGCTVTKTVTVGANNVTSVTGLPWVCTGLTSTLTSGNGAGNWTSANPAICSFSGSTTGTTAAVLGVSAGVTVITYTRTSDGCFKTIVVSSHTQPALITGAYTLCNGATTTLTDATTGGSWTSGNTDIATVTSGGLVKGISSGPVTITYAMPGGCETYQPITVRPMPNAIAGASAVCLAGTTTLTDMLPGGVWSSSDVTKGSIDAATGVVTGIGAGSFTVTYTVGTCFVTKAITVGTINPTITTSAMSVCATGTASKNIIASNGGGTWSGSNNFIATVAANGTTAARVTGVAAGTMNVTYTLNGCFTTQSETVVANTMPAITGNSEVCAGNTTVLANTTSGGIWSSGNTAVATVGTSGIVTGVAPGGSAIITYGIDSGGCRQWFSMNVGNVTPAAITTTTLNPMCAGATTTYTDATAGGTWTSSNSSVVSVNPYGVLLGVGAGVANITYTLVGCYATPVSVTVNAVPVPITGTASVCVGSTTTLADTSGGGTGTWSSTLGTKGTVDAVTGVVTGIAAGSETIKYTLNGCSVSKAVAIGASPAAITGATSVCSGSSVTLADATSGGTWTSSDITIAENTGGGAAFTGVLGGTVTISYTTPGCTPVTASLTVNYIAPITSASYSLCKTDSVLFVDATAGGTWSKVVDTIAALSVVTPGMILGTGSGTSNITYTVGSCYVTQQAFVNGCGHKVGGQSGVVENQVYTLYPNPSNGNVFIAQSIADDGVKEISVMNSVGVKVFSGHIEFSGGKGQINLVVAPGMYVLLMRDQNGDINPFKILIED